jgi:dyslexia susceptibility 1 candidate gene 1 protein
MKIQAAEHIKNNELPQVQLYLEKALEIYKQCLKKITLTHLEDVIAYCSILLNKSICHLKNEEYDDIISSCVRGIKIIKNFKNRVISFEKTTKDSKDKLNNFEVRFLVRRGNAYLKQGQVYNALNDMEEAFKLDPKNK